MATMCLSPRDPKRSRKESADDSSKFVDGSMSYAMPRNPKPDGNFFKFLDAMATTPKRDRAGADDDSSMFVDSKEADYDEDEDTSKLVPKWHTAESAAAYLDYISCVLLHATLAGVQPPSIPVLKKFPNQQRNCGHSVCEEPHLDEAFGWSLWQVMSIKLRLSMNKPEPKVSIYGEIMVGNRHSCLDYLFKRQSDKPQVFENPNPGEELTLALEGPQKPRVLVADRGWVSLYARLKYNDTDIFTGTWFYEDHTVGGVGALTLCSEGSFFENTKFRKPIIEEVASVQVELEVIGNGKVGILEITSYRDLDLYGDITACSCLRTNGIVLFHKTQEEALAVKSNELIPLSRSMAAVSGSSSLVIKVDLRDAKDSNFHMVDTIHFNVGLRECTSEKLMSNGVIKVAVKWTIPTRICEEDAEGELESFLLPSFLRDKHTLDGF